MKNQFTVFVVPGTADRSCPGDNTPPQSEGRRTVLSLIRTVIGALSEPVFARLDDEGVV